MRVNQSKVNGAKNVSKEDRSSERGPGVLIYIMGYSSENSVVMINGLLTVGSISLRSSVSMGY